MPEDQSIIRRVITGRELLDGSARYTLTFLQPYGKRGARYDFRASEAGQMMDALAYAIGDLSPGEAVEIMGWAPSKEHK